MRTDDTAAFLDADEIEELDRALALLKRPPRERIQKAQTTVRRLRDRARKRKQREKAK